MGVFIPRGEFADMPLLTEDELLRKSDPDRVDADYKDFDPANRIVIRPDNWAKMLATLGHIVIPRDPKSDINLPPRGDGAPKIAVVPSVSDADIERWKAEGYDVNQFGWRINPRAPEVMTRPGFGMFSGRGKYWKLGPNRIGNVGIYADGAYLMTLSDRGKGDVWSLPGGHEKEDEDVTLEDTGQRETREETGVPQEYSDQLRDEDLYDHFVWHDWPQADRGATAEAWQTGETHLYASKDPVSDRILGTLNLRPMDPDEGIKEVALVPLEAILSGAINVIGGHVVAIRAHQKHLMAQR